MADIRPSSVWATVYATHTLCRSNGCDSVYAGQCEKAAHKALARESSVDPEDVGGACSRVEVEDQRVHFSGTANSGRASALPYDLCGVRPHQPRIFDGLRARRLVLPATKIEAVRERLSCCAEISLVNGQESF